MVVGSVMTKAPKADDKFSDKETENRMAAALRGARLAGHKPMKPAVKN